MPVRRPSPGAGLVKIVGHAIACRMCQKAEKMKAKLKEIRDKSDENLQKEVLEKRKHLFDLRSQAVTEKLEDPTQIGKTKREIARLHTIIKERQLAASKK